MNARKLLESVRGGLSTQTVLRESAGTMHTSGTLQMVHELRDDGGVLALPKDKGPAKLLGCGMKDMLFPDRVPTAHELAGVKDFHWLFYEPATLLPIRHSFPAFAQDSQYTYHGIKGITK